MIMVHWIFHLFLCQCNRSAVGKAGHLESGKGNESPQNCKVLVLIIFLAMNQTNLMDHYVSAQSFSESSRVELGDSYINYLSHCFY